MSTDLQDPKRDEERNLIDAMEESLLDNLRPALVHVVERLFRNGWMPARILSVIKSQSCGQTDVYFAVEILLRKLAEWKLANAEH